MIVELGASAYLNELPGRFRQGAHHVHLAHVEFGDAIIPCFIKIFPPDTGGLVNEAIGWLLAGACQINVARRAAFITIPVHRLASRAPSWAVNGNTDEIRAWAIESIPGEPLSFLHRGADDELWDEVINNVMGRRISAFDEWTSNNDRHGGNLIRDARRRWWAIDFSELLGSYAWSLLVDFPIVDHHPTELLRRAQDRLRTPALQQFKNAMIEAAEGHDAAFAQLRDAVAKIVHQEHGAAAAELVISFLTQRAHRNWMPDRLRLI